MWPTAELLEGIYRLRAGLGERVDADFVLRLRTPSGLEEWDFNWGLWDLTWRGLPGETLEEQCGEHMRSLFDDHMYDLAQRRLQPDRTFDALPVRVEAPPDLRRRIEGSRD
jgi:hypothetical protein